MVSQANSFRSYSQCILNYSHVWKQTMDYLNILIASWQKKTNMYDKPVYVYSIHKWTDYLFTNSNCQEIYIYEQVTNIISLMFAGDIANVTDTVGLV